MPFNLLLLPLLGGFLLLHRAYAFRFYFARFDGHRLIFFSAFAGVCLLALSTLVTYAIGYYWGAVAQAWHDIVPFAHSGKAFGALVLGYLLPPLLLNRIKRLSKDPCARKAIAYFGNELEMLLLRSIYVELPVLLTLSNGKVYVGYVVRMFNPDIERKHIRIFPVVSGYRRKESLEVRFTTFYDMIREQSADPDSGINHLEDEDFELVIPVAEIKTVSLFDFQTYAAFRKLERD